MRAGTAFFSPDLRRLDRCSGMPPRALPLVAQCSFRRGESDFLADVGARCAFRAQGPLFGRAKRARGGAKRAGAVVIRACGRRFGAVQPSSRAFGAPPSATPPSKRRFRRAKPMSLRPKRASVVDNAGASMSYGERADRRAERCAGAVPPARPARRSMSPILRNLHDVAGGAGVAIHDYGLEKAPA